MQFEHIGILILAPILAILAWILLTQRTYIGYSSLSLFKGVRTINLDFAQRFFVCAAIVLVVIAVAKPYSEEVSRRTSFQEGREIIFVFDTSSSMTEAAIGGKKIDIAKVALTNFVKGRKTDRIGLLSFNDKTQLEWPLCFAEKLSGLHDPILARIESLKASGGTHIALALLAALDHADALANKETKAGKAIILVSDGVSEVREDEAQEIIARSNEAGIKVYWVFIRGADASELSRSYYADKINSVKAVVEASGGKVFEMAPEDIEAAIAEIGRLEAAPIVTVEEETVRVYHLRSFLLAALPLLILAAIAEIVKEL